VGEDLMKEESDILSDDDSGKDTDDDESCGGSVKVTQVHGGNHSYLDKCDSFDIDSCENVSESYMSSSGMKTHQSHDDTTPPTRMIQRTRGEDDTRE
jgi:hypothetical protein